jgi:hypothetical protein
MKKTFVLFAALVLSMPVATAQQAPPDAPDSGAPANTIVTTVGFPTERVQTPTSADLYCAGFINPKPLPNANFVAGGLDTPNTTKFANGEMVYLAGGGYQVGQEYTVIRELRDPNRFELFPGQHSLINAAGQPYSELARLRVVDTRSKMAIAQVEFSCDPVNPGDTVVPFTDKQAISFHAPQQFDRFLPPTGKTSGRIVMAKDFDYELGTGMKVYMNVGSSQGVKVGDYLRAERAYSQDLKDPADSLSFKASTTEDTQKHPPTVEPNILTHGKGPTIHVSDLPRRGVGEIVVLTTTPTTSTGMIVFALEDVHPGDMVELDQQ